MILSPQLEYKKITIHNDAVKHIKKNGLYQEKAEKNPLCYNCGKNNQSHKGRGYQIIFGNSNIFYCVNCLKYKEVPM